LGPIDAIHGSSQFYYSNQGDDTTYTFTSDQASTKANGDSEDTNIQYGYTIVDDDLEVDFSYTHSVTENDETVIQGCSGWWEQDNIDLTDPGCTEAEWFLENCAVIDPVTNNAVNAGDINFSTLRGQSLLYSDWQCTSGNNAWTFNFATCSWENTQGTTELVEVKNVYDQQKLAKTSQRFLSF
jgi:hypothetical protein